MHTCLQCIISSHIMSTRTRQGIDPHASTNIGMEDEAQMASRPGRWAAQPAAKMPRVFPCH